MVYKTSNIWDHEEQYFFKAKDMCSYYGWDYQSFRNHKSRLKKDKFIFKGKKIELININ